MRILLTEATGELGRALAQSLLSAGHDVSGIAQRPHRDLDPGVDFVGAALAHPVLYRLTEQADVVIHLAAHGDAAARPADIARICDAAARGGARIIFPSLSLLEPEGWQQADDLVSTGWAPSLIVRMAAPLGRQTEALVCRSVAALLRRTDTEPVHVLHVDDLIRFLVLAAGTDRTGTVDLAAADTTTTVSAHRLLGNADPRPRVRGVPGWHRVCAPLDLTPLRTHWRFECGWSATDTLLDTVRGLQGRKTAPGGAVGIPGRIPMPVAGIPRATGPQLHSAAPEGAEGEFDDRIDARFPAFVANPLGSGPGPLTPMSLDLHGSGLRTAARTLARLLDLPGPLAGEWESRLVAVFGHRIYLGASALAAAEPRLQARAALLSQRLRGCSEQPAAAGRLASITGAMSTTRLLSSARMYGRHLHAYRDAADAERLDPTRLALLQDAQLEARIRLLRSRIHEGWVLSALAVLYAETAPAQLEGVGERASIRAELASLARVLRAHPYARTALEAGDVAAARTAAPMLASAFDATLAHIGHRGPGAAELAISVLADQPVAMIAAAAAIPSAQVDDEEPKSSGASGCRALAYDVTLRFTHQLRLATRELGRRLVAQDKLATQDDVFYLTVEEALRSPPDSRLRIKRRIAERERLQAVRLPATFDTAWAPVAGADELTVDDELLGTGLFPAAAETPGYTVSR